MDAVSQVLATTSEISLKGGNRRWFERTLTKNVRRALDDLPVATITRPSWRMLITFENEVPFPEVARRLATVFGLGSFMAVDRVGHTLEELENHLASRLENAEAASFAVRCTRSDKRFAMTSPEIERSIGSFVQEKTGWPVDLGNPALTIRILVEEKGLFTWMTRVSGPGGMPVGVSGRGTCLISGGIDSPVAAWLLMKRGMNLDFVHFHSVPRTDPASLEKVEDLVRILGRFQGPARLAMVPLLPIQEQIAAQCPSEFRVLLYRRFMLRLADRIADRLHSSALITGEALGQVASQTIENLGAVEAVATMPVLRPLIALDKQEIITIGRRIGTYEISILPHFDCCSFLLPDNPATRSKASDLEKAEEALDVQALVDAALEATEIKHITDPVPWTEIPMPEGVGG
jgi:thiamine biosynthesis protein ThiI